VTLAAIIAVETVFKAVNGRVRGRVCIRGSTGIQAMAYAGIIGDSV